MRSRKVSLAFVSLLVAIPLGWASAVELRDAQLVAGGVPELQNGAGTVRILNPELGGEIFVPEPRVAAQLGVGIAALALTMARRRKTALMDSLHGRGSASAGE
jgi:hypothetical protein